MRKRLLFCAGAVLALGGAASASTMTFYGLQAPGGGVPQAFAAQQAFLSHLASWSTDTFENHPTGPTFVRGLNGGTSFAANLTGSGAIQNTEFGGRRPVSPSKYWETQHDFGIGFLNPVAAIGFFFVDLADEGSQTNELILVLNLEDGTQDAIRVPTLGSLPNGSIGYFGLLRTSGPRISSIAFNFTAAGTGDFVAFDDFTFGSPPEQVVPLPPAAWAGLATLAAIGGVRQIRRRAR